MPQLSDCLFLTDGGLETTLIFLEGIDLPCFAAFDLLKTASGSEALRRYFRTYATLARKHNTGLILESATWRASAEWGAKLGHSQRSLAELNRRSIALLDEIRRENEAQDSPMVISGCIGPRGDGYIADDRMSAHDAERYHAFQVDIFRDTSADMVSAITMTYPEEAIGITRAARSAHMPVAISFTVETDGRLPTGQDLKDAIEQVDRDTNYGPSYYMINCAHPEHFQNVFAQKGPWVKRIRGLRANASRKSHAELNESTALDAGDPVEFAGQHKEIKDRIGHINILGGCCGTDHRHVDAIASRCGTAAT